MDHVRKCNNKLDIDPDDLDDTQVDIEIDAENKGINLSLPHSLMEKSTSEGPRKGWRPYLPSVGFASKEQRAAFLVRKQTPTP